jgi:hypothetical protein
MGPQPELDSRVLYLGLAVLALVIVLLGLRVAGVF